MSVTCGCVQGDRDTKYDVMLFAPVVLISKVIIMNIKEVRRRTLMPITALPPTSNYRCCCCCCCCCCFQGRLQKNNILEKLDVLQTVVSKINWGDHGGKKHMKLGHLHIVMRDWISDEGRGEVYETLMRLEEAAPGRKLAEDAERR